MSVFKYKIANHHLPVKINLPASKSISNRLLLLNTLFNNVLDLENISLADDTQLLQEILLQINHGVDIEIDVKDAGTVCRFLLAYTAICEGKSFTLVGTKRMSQRPLQSLIDTLQELGADVICTEKNGFLPCKINGSKLKKKNIVIDGSASSQFVSAMCMIACKIEQGLNISVQQNTVSYAYINMTIQLMKQIGIPVYCHNHEIIIEETKSIAPQKIWIENDWSSASFFYAMLMIDSSFEFLFENLSINSLQGDHEIVEIAKHFNIETSIHHGITHIFLNKKNNILHQDLMIDVTNIPDMAIPLIVAFAFKYPQVTISGFSHLQYKESNRVEALKNELLHWNIHLQISDNLLSFDNSNLLLEKDKIIKVKTYHDHRIAMAFTLPLLLGYQIEFDDVDCVSKSFPAFWEQVKKIGIDVS